MTSTTIDSLLFRILSTGRPYKGANEQRMATFITRCIESVGGKVTSDAHGNVFCSVRADDSDVNSVLFTAHMDTVHSSDCDLHLMVCQMTDDDTADQILFANALNGGASVLGADDGAGIFLLLNMIKGKVVGDYAFFVGEERGRVGSQAYLRDVTSDVIKTKYTKVISFDRRGTGDIVTTQRGGVCCSTEFSTALSKQLADRGLSYAPAAGSYTDSATFMGCVSECTNISVGYELEHTTQENLNVTHLMKLRDAVLAIDWQGLPAVRVAAPEKKQKRSWGSGWGTHLTAKEVTSCKSAIDLLYLLQLDIGALSKDSTLTEDFINELQDNLAEIYTTLDSVINKDDDDFPF